jgi:hypothetical protein
MIDCRGAGGRRKVERIFSSVGAIAGASVTNKVSDCEKKAEWTYFSVDIIKPALETNSLWQ